MHKWDDGHPDKSRRELCEGGGGEVRLERVIPYIRTGSFDVPAIHEETVTVATYNHNYSNLYSTLRVVSRFGTCFVGRLASSDASKTTRGSNPSREIVHRLSRVSVIHVKSFLAGQQGGC